MKHILLFLLFASLTSAAQMKSTKVSAEPNAKFAQMCDEFVKESLRSRR
jgi:hypothetical protein